MEIHVFFEEKQTGTGTILCDFGVHFEVQFHMFFEEKLVFGVAYFLFDFDVFFGRGRRQGQGPSRPQILQHASIPGHALLPLWGAANI